MTVSSLPPEALVKLELTALALREFAHYHSTYQTYILKQLSDETYEQLADAVSDDPRFADHMSSWLMLYLMTRDLRMMRLRALACFRKTALTRPIHCKTSSLGECL